jgi:hypothetical protein
MGPDCRPSAKWHVSLRARSGAERSGACRAGSHGPGPGPEPAGVPHNWYHSGPVSQGRDTARSRSAAGPPVPRLPVHRRRDCAWSGKYLVPTGATNAVTHGEPYQTVSQPWSKAIHQQGGLLHHHLALPRMVVGDQPEGDHLLREHFPHHPAWGAKGELTQERKSHIAANTA